MVNQLGQPIAPSTPTPTTPVAIADGNFLTPDQAAEYLKVSKGTMTVWRSTKKGPAYSKTGNRRGAVILYKKEDLDIYNLAVAIRRRKPKTVTE